MMEGRANRSEGVIFYNDEVCMEMSKKHETFLLKSVGLSSSLDN